MNGNLPEENLQNATREEIITAIFANLVIEHSQTALMLMGRMPNPQGGPPMKDLENAKRFIDELEMIAEKTKGNLNQQEQQLLRQSLGTLRAIFIQEIEAVLPEGADDAPGTEFQFAPPGEGAMGNQFGAPPSFSTSPQPQPSPQQPAPQRPPQSEPRPAAPPIQEPEPAPGSTGPERPDESRKKFSKKY